MADGELTLRFSDEDLSRLQADANAFGMPVAEYAHAVLTRRGGYYDLAEDERILEEYDRTGVGYTVEEAAAYFHSELMKQVEKSR